MTIDKENIDAVVAEPVDDSEDEMSSEGESDIEESKGVDGTAPKGRQNKNERRSRKLLNKMGLKLVEGITKVCIKKSKQVFFVINKPDVYKLPNSDTYVVFGEAKVEDMTQNSAIEAAHRLSQLSAVLQSADTGTAGGKETGERPSDANMDDNKDDSEDLTVTKSPTPGDSTEGYTINSSDIDLVMTQVGCTREQAKQGLLRHNGDIVETILDLSS
ncbi:Nascent polypeptide-associated complex subunit alpha [Babesia sp. Xinjiang]|uniref:Nascent polypeptide-associated complex subunit alpha n=1 Tax=Babesia sp. Xinjiang TaxID=462227 RepID=UPI000A2338B3|nr:Nascent polypeptide-associated complex subunit alpha [Babesia sp. Xinjiang]ORM40105.1 Nascent polypeptide-associated complex subunit alpha [Babesia sp. Xinjiang]